MIGILGANGFIGRSLADHLAKIDRPYTAYMRGKSFQNPPSFLACLQPMLSTLFFFLQVGPFMAI